MTFQRKFRVKTEIVYIFDWRKWLLVSLSTIVSDWIGSAWLLTVTISWLFVLIEIESFRPWQIDRPSWSSSSSMRPRCRGRFNNINIVSIASVTLRLNVNRHFGLKSSHANSCLALGTLVKLGISISYSCYFSFSRTDVAFLYQDDLMNSLEMRDILSPLEIPWWICVKAHDYPCFWAK